MMSATPENRFTDRLTSILVERSVITADEIARFRRRADCEGRCLADLLVADNAVDREVVLDAAGMVLDAPAVSISDAVTDRAIAEVLPPPVAHAFKAVPLFVVENEVTLAMSDPFDLKKVDELSFRIGMAVNPVFALASEIEKYLDLLYGPLSREVECFVSIEYEQGKKSEQGPAAASDEVQRYEEGEGGDNPIIRLVDLILRIALEDGATDVHIEPRGDFVVVRNRIDGLLREKPSKIPANASRAMVSRIKVLAGLDITERSVPQDGKISLKYESRNVDVRVSTFPTIRGEKVVLRLLDRSRRSLDLGSLGLSADDHETWRRLLALRDGIILVTGPTGCGKTSTLYASLNYLKSPELNIVTLEDPVEYEDADFSQGQVNKARGFTFASGLRSILRQDPDVILIGEVRDQETAQIAVQAALTGHLVLATLHTNDAPSAVTRLTDIGLPSYLIAATLRGVLAQRLVRQVCSRCGGQSADASSTPGCPNCDDSGYKGRIGIYELLAIGSELKEAISAGSRDFQDAVERSQYSSLWEDGLRKVAEGVTDLAELKRVVPEALTRKDRLAPDRASLPTVVDRPKEFGVPPLTEDTAKERFVRLLTANDLGAPM